jgi:hypothetical protein
MKLRFYSRIYWRGLLPGLYLSWEETTLTIEVYWGGPGPSNLGVSILGAETKVEVPKRIEPWLLPRWDRWAKDRSWVN